MPKALSANLPDIVGRSTLLLCLCTSLIITTAERPNDGISSECQARLRSFGARLQARHVPSDPKKMLYFLHIPRTAGRTYGACFLKQAWAPSRRCAKSYDVLRLNTSMPNCGLLSSHDDFSVSQYLPAHVAIATQLRDPVQRVLSTYEFAIEVAARSLAGPTDSDNTKVRTQDVWPWSLLVPFMRQDTAQRVRQPSFCYQHFLTAAYSCCCCLYNSLVAAHHSCHLCRVMAAGFQAAFTCHSR